MRTYNKKMGNTNYRIVYIAGYGRSGSTLLDIILGTHNSFVSTGELTYLLEDAVVFDRTCSCGKKYIQCNIWGKALERLRLLGVDIKAANEVVREIEKRGSILDVFKTFPLPSVEHSNLYQLIAQCYTECVVSKGVQTLVDSSKTAGDAFWRPLALQNVAGVPVKVIHLKRSLVSTLLSVMKTDNWAEESHERVLRFRLFRSILGWLLANFQARRLKNLMGDEHYLYVEYEEFISDPTGVLKKIGDFLNEDLSDIVQTIQSGGAFVVGHNVGGNRLRLKKEVIVKVTTRDAEHTCVD